MADPTPIDPRAGSLRCKHCDQPIDLSGNYAPAGPAHVGCQFVNRPAPSDVRPADPELARFVQQLRTPARFAACVTGPYSPADHGTRVSENRWGSGAYWDQPGIGHMTWVVISQTPCLVEDLGLPEPDQDPWKAPVWHTCRRKHIHAGSRTLVPGAPPLASARAVTGKRVGAEPKGE